MTSQIFHNTLNKTDLTLEQFDQATEHPYECTCEICKKWWEEMGEEE